MDSISTSETSVNVYQTKRGKIPDDNILKICRRGNLKFHSNQTILAYFP
jgi:hypothetical protein